MLQNHIYPYDNFIIIGDPHLRFRYSSNSDLDYRGKQPLKVVLDSIKHALIIAETDKCPAYIAGDLFDRANFNHVETASIIKLFDKVTCPIYIIRGNHDTSLVHKWGEPYPKNHILYVLEEACPNVQIFHTDYQNKKKHIFIKEYSEFESIAYVLYTLPYMESETSFIQALEDIRQDAKETENQLNTTLNDDRVYGVEPLLICHQSIDPLVPDVTVKPEHFKGFRRVWNGHLHERAYLGNPTSSTSEQIRILGSLTFQTLSDKGKPAKGYYHIHLGEKLEEEFIELNQPQIIECKEGEEPKNDFDYVHWIRTQNNAVTQSEEVFTEVDDVSKDGRKTLIQDFLFYSDNNQKEVEEILLDLISEGSSMSDQGFKEIHFKEIRMEGFLSYAGKETYDLQYPGKSYIHGLEGSGKSNILKALTWVLTGSYWNRKKKFTDPTSYETYANQVEDFSGCRVELDLEINEEPYNSKDTWQV